MSQSKSSHSLRLQDVLKLVHFALDRRPLLVLPDCTTSVKKINSQNPHLLLESPVGFRLMLPMPPRPVDSTFLEGEVCDGERGTSEDRWI